MDWCPGRIRWGSKFISLSSLSRKGWVFRQVFGIFQIYTRKSSDPETTYWGGRKIHGCVIKFIFMIYQVENNHWSSATLEGVIFTCMGHAEQLEHRKLNVWFTPLKSITDTYLIILSHETPRYGQESVSTALCVFHKVMAHLLMPNVVETRGMVAMHHIQLLTSPVKTCWCSTFISNAPSSGAFVTNNPRGEGRGEDLLQLSHTRTRTHTHTHTHKGSSDLVYLFLCLVS